MTFIKFCGMTREADVAIACELGVDAVGFVLWPPSPRYVDLRSVAALVARLPAAVDARGRLRRPDLREIWSAQSMRAFGSCRFMVASFRRRCPFPCGGPALSTETSRAVTERHHPPARRARSRAARRHGPND